MRDFESEKEDEGGGRKRISTYGKKDSISDRNRRPMSRRGSVGTSIGAVEVAAKVGKVWGDEEKEREEKMKWNRGGIQGRGFEREEGGDR